MKSKRFKKLPTKTKELPANSIENLINIVKGNIHCLKFCISGKPIR